MRPDLMRTSRFQHAFYQCHIPIALQNLIMSHGWLSNIRVGRKDFHPETVFRITADIPFYPSFILHKIAPHQCIIAPVGGLVEELLTQRSLGVWRLCHNEQTAGILIYTMHKSHLGIVRIVCRQIFQVPGNGIHQCTVEIATTGMHHQTCGFIDDHQVIVLINHIQRNFLRQDRCVIVWTVKHQCDDITWTNLIIALHGMSFSPLLAVAGRTHIDKAGIGSLLYPITARMRLMLGQELVDSNRLLSFVHFYTEVFKELSRHTVTFRLYLLQFRLLLVIIPLSSHLSVLTSRFSPILRLPQIRPHYRFPSACTRVPNSRVPPPSHTCCFQ